MGEVQSALDFMNIASTDHVYASEFVISQLLQSSAWNLNRQAAVSIHSTETWKDVTDYKLIHNDCGTYTSGQQTVILSSSARISTIACYAAFPTHMSTITYYAALPIRLCIKHCFVSVCTRQYIPVKASPVIRQV